MVEVPAVALEVAPAVALEVPLVEQQVEIQQLQQQALEMNQV